MAACHLVWTEAAPMTGEQGADPPPDLHATLPAGSPPTNAPAPAHSAWCPTGYEILARLGAGGNGQVYKARHKGLDRIVALKRLLNPAATSEERERFMAEARAVARLDHPNIIRIHDFGIHESLEWYSLEFCPRGSLADRLREGPMALEAACQAILTVARAAGHAHAEGIIHRDIKPGNVLIANGNVLKLADFGLAKAADALHSRDNIIAGTPAYMAPEQINAPGRIGPPTDVWALGVMMYECLTGRVPFTGVTVMQVMQRITGAEPVAPRALNDAIPADLNTICLHALRKDPEKRYRSTAALAADIEAWLEGRPIAVRAVTRFERGLKWTRRNPALAWSIGSLMAAVALGTALSVAFGMLALREAALLKQETVRFSMAVAESRRMARLMRVAAAQAAWDKFQWQRFISLAGADSPREVPLFEESLWRRRAVIDRQNLGATSRPGTSAISRRIHPGTALVSNADGRAMILKTDGGAIPLEHEGKAHRLESPEDGCHWVMSDSGGIAVFSPNGQRALSGPPGPWSGLAVARDGAKAARWGDRSLELLGKGLRPEQTLTGESPDALWADNAPVLAIRWLNPPRIDLVRHGSHPVSIPGAGSPFALSPDGRFLVAASNGKIHKWETTHGDRDTAFEPRLGPCAFLRFSADGSRLVSAGGTELRVLDATRGRGLQFWMTPGTAIEGIELAPNGGRCLSWGDGIAQAWNLDDGGQQVIRGVAGPAGAWWESGFFVHPALAGDHWEKRPLVPEAFPKRLRLEGWQIDSIGWSDDRWVVAGKHGGMDAACEVNADGVVKPASGSFRAPVFSGRLRLINGALESATADGWKVIARRATPILTFSEDIIDGIAGIATAGGIVERLDSRDGTTIWDDKCPENPAAMAMGEGGVAVAGRDGALWIWPTR